LGTSIAQYRFINLESAHPHIRKNRDVIDCVDSVMIKKTIHTCGAVSAISLQILATFAR
jgi:hypothetical protein